MGYFRAKRLLSARPQRTAAGAGYRSRREASVSALKPGGRMLSPRAAQIPEAIECSAFTPAAACWQSGERLAPPGRGLALRRQAIAGRKPALKSKRSSTVTIAESECSSAGWQRPAAEARPEQSRPDLTAASLRSMSASRQRGGAHLHALERARRRGRARLCLGSASVVCAWGWATSVARDSWRGPTDVDARVRG